MLVVLVQSKEVRGAVISELICSRRHFAWRGDSVSAPRYYRVFLATIMEEPDIQY
jgi:hypothetical protein